MPVRHASVAGVITLLPHPHTEGDTPIPASCFDEEGELDSDAIFCAKCGNREADDVSSTRWQGPRTERKEGRAVSIQFYGPVKAPVPSGAPLGLFPPLQNISSPRPPR